MFAGFCILIITWHLWDFQLSHILIIIRLSGFLKSYFNISEVISHNVSFLSLAIYDVEHLFKWYFVICVFYLLKSLIKFFVHLQFQIAQMACTHLHICKFRGMWFYHVSRFICPLAQTRFKTVPLPQGSNTLSIHKSVLLLPLKDPSLPLTTGI